MSFEAVLVEICERLEAEGRADTAELAKRGRELSARIDGWTKTKPSDDERTATIHEVTQFNQTALELLRRSSA